MSISVMQEGEVMGRGIKAPLIEARTRARLKGAARDESPIVILGAGPAGLLAAHAVALAGGNPVIFSSPDPESPGRPAKSPMNGAIFLHEPIPDITSAEPDGQIHFAKVGSRNAYAYKLYGSRFAPCSWDRFDEGLRPAWALQPVYDELWKRYEPSVIPMDLDAEAVGELHDSFVSMVSTIPAHVLCSRRNEHEFPSRKIWVEPTASEATHVLARTLGVDNIIVYDGVREAMSARYRSSIIFGEEATEYARFKPGAIEGTKVVRRTNCDCLPEIVRAGRWGCWEPGVLVNHAFKKVWDMMFNEFEGL